MNDVSSRSHAIFTLVFSQVGLHMLCCVCSCVLVHRRDSVVKGTTREENNTNKTPLAFLYCHGARLLSYLFLHDKQFGNILLSCDVVRHFLLIFFLSLAFNIACTVYVVESEVVLVTMGNGKWS